jgi:hypothetical protein
MGLLYLLDGVSVSLATINVWRLTGDTLNITCNFLYCNNQVHRYLLITLYMYCALLHVLHSGRPSRHAVSVPEKCENQKCSFQEENFKRRYLSNVIGNVRIA